MDDEPKINLSTLAKQFSDEGEAYKLMEHILWPDGPKCPHCENMERVYFLKPKDGVRRTSTGKVSHRRLWKCGECRKQFSVLVGTIFENSKVPLSKWLMAVYMMSANKNGVAAFELHRTLGVTHKSAWYMLHRIRYAMTRSPVVDKLEGTIVSDETFIGGSPRNKHRQGRVRPGTSKGHAGTPHHKTAVLTLVNKDSGEARSQVIADVTGPTLHKVLSEQVTASSRLHTDGWKPYRAIGREFAGHEYVDHGSYEYVRGDVSTNQAENFFSQLKRSIDGTHHRVSREHLERYLAEFDFRYSTRKMTDSARMAKVIRQGEGKRLTYRRVLSA